MDRRVDILDEISRLIATKSAREEEYRRWIARHPHGEAPGLRLVVAGLESRILDLQQQLEQLCRPTE